MLVAAAVAGVFVLAVPASEEKTKQPGIGAETILLDKPDPTGAGSFDGTWIYVNRDARFVLWSRVKDGVRQMRVQFQSLASPEAFETDWDGKADYYMAGSQVTFNLKLGASTPDRIDGTWSWLLEFGPLGRRETADLVIYRTGYGRKLLMDFQNYQKTITRGGQDQVMKAPMAWTWIKVSKRELLWDELPF
jgi:hypothetical protein